MNYDDFKRELTNRFRDFLPEPYNSWVLKVSEVAKVNEVLETINLVPETGAAAVPNLYINELYDVYRSCGDMGNVLARAAEAFLTGMQYTKRVAAQLHFEDPKEHIVYMLVNTAMNEKLLRDVPHRNILDLSIVYRLVAELPGEGLNSAIITKNALKQYSFDEEALFTIASANTPKLMPLILEEISDTFYLLTNYRRVLGASALLYDGVLDRAAEKMDSDLYVLPSSIHEVFCVPDFGQDLEMMRKTVNDANASVVRQNEILSGNVYHYSRRKRQLTIASDSVLN